MKRNKIGKKKGPGKGKGNYAKKKAFLVSVNRGRKDAGLPLVSGIDFPEDKKPWK